MKSPVYFVKAGYNEGLTGILKKLRLLYKAVGFSRLIKKDDYVALKMHFGEEGGKGFIRPEWVKVIVDLIKKEGAKSFLTDTTTLYLGPRANAVDHLLLAYEHGFSIEQIGCPVIIGDGLLGEHQVSLKTNPSRPGGTKQVHLAGIARVCDVIIALSHPTGHLLTGYGGNLKNLGMGLAGRGGKLAQHSGIIPQLITEKCEGCGVCLEWCPVGAITIQDDKMKINPILCIGCGECFAVCPQEALKITWDESSASMQKKMVEYVSAVLHVRSSPEKIPRPALRGSRPETPLGRGKDSVSEGKNKKAGFINFATHITKHCDCMGKEIGKPIISDLGILASFDPVAIDMATIDLLNQAAGRDVFKDAWPEVDYTVQLTYAEKIGLGRRDYQLHVLTT